MFSSKLLKASFSKLYTEEEKINLDISVFVFDCFFFFFFYLMIKLLIIWACQGLLSTIVLLLRND